MTTTTAPPATRGSALADRLRQPSFWVEWRP